MKLLVLIFLCSCVFGVPLGEQEEALAELLQKVLEADPEENDIIIEEPIKKDASTVEKNVIANATELPVDKVDTTSITEGEPKKEKHSTIIGEIILDPIPEEDTTENQPVTEIIEQNDAKSDLDKDTKPLTGTLIVETITDDDENDNTNSETEGPAVPDYPDKSPMDEPKRDPSEYDGLDTVVRIPLNHERLHRDWVDPFPNRFRIRPLNRDYDDHFKMLENPFLSPLDTLPMDQDFFESTTNADYDVPSQDYPMYDDVYDDEQTPKNMNNESSSSINSLEPIPEENDVIQESNDVKVPDEQTNEEDSTTIPLEETPEGDLPPSPNAGAVDNSESIMPLNSDGIPDDVKGDYDYADHQMQDYPLQNNPEFERNYFSNNMEREPDFIRINDRDRFRPHYYDSYDKYINIGDIKNFNPYLFYPKRQNGYDLFFRPSYDVENRGKMTPLAPSSIMEPPRNAEVKYDDSDNMNFDKTVPEENIETNMDEVNTNIDNTNDYVDNENAESVDQLKDNSYAEQGAPQDVYNEDYDSEVKWNPSHSVVNPDFTPMAESLPIHRRSPMIEVPRYFDNGLPYYDDNNKDTSTYMFNRLVRNLGDDSRFRRFHEYKNNPYSRNDGPIIIFVGPPRNRNEDTNLDTNQVASESDNQYINSEGTLLTDIKHNVDLPYSPGYHPAFYSNYHLYENSDNNNIDDERSFSEVEVPLNHPYNDVIESYPYQEDHFGYPKKYFKRGTYRNRDYRYINDYDNLYKPDRYYYRREPRNFMDDNLYY
ncbi:UNVERIFIED_CONTAM: hypothetical protein RMT77_003426 [Armadillidium vulgare]